VIVEPFSALPNGEHSSATSHACSCGWPSRPSGTDRPIPARTVSGYFSIASVSKCPAATALTAIPRSRHRSASSRVSASTVARAAPECAIPGIPWCGESVTFTILPPVPSAGRSADVSGPPPPAGAPPPALPRPSPASTAACATFSIPSTFNLHTAIHPFATIPSAAVKYWPPALFTTMSSLPNLSIAAPTISRACAGSRTSPARAATTSADASPVTAPVAVTISCAAPSNTSWRRPAISTLAPQRTSSIAVAFPSPVPPPVTSPTLPASSPGANTSETSLPRTTPSDTGAIIRT